MSVNNDYVQPIGQPTASAVWGSRRRSPAILHKSAEARHYGLKTSTAVLDDFAYQSPITLLC